MSVSTAEDFLDVLQRSKLLDAEQMAHARQDTAAGRSAAAVARAMADEGILSRWQAAQLLAGRTSFLIGRYKLIDLLGRGGMGSVFLAEHTMMNRRVALKILARQVGQEPARLERFLTEARTIASLDHPNIVQAYNVDNEGDRYYIVMEYIDGVDLNRLVATQGPLDFEHAVEFIRQAADGLAHAHERGVVHCDIKPSNLVVNQQGVVKILDMGLARLTGRERGDATEPEEGVLGSVDYLAPEQATGAPDFDHRADIYALGCTLYFLLTGHPPFPEGTLTERILKHQTQEPASILRKRPDTPLDLIDICERMMAKRPDDRYQSAAELSEVLGKWHPPRPMRVPPKTTESPRITLRDSQAMPVLSVKPPVRSGTTTAPAKREPDVAAATVTREPASRPGPNGALAPVVRSDVPLAGRGTRQAKPELLGTPQRKMAAAVIAFIAVALLLAGTVAVLVVLTSRSHKQPQGDAAAPNEGTAAQVAGRPTAALNAAKPEPPPPDPPKSEPPKSEPPKSEPAKAEGPKPEEAKPQPQPEQPKAEKPPEPAKPEKPAETAAPPPAPKPDPLRELAASVELPPLLEKSSTGQVGGTVSLGRVHLEPGASLDVQLLGGKAALRGNQQLHLQRDAGASTTPVWIVHLERIDAPDDNPDRTNLARISLDGENLKFQWLETATRPRASALRHCGLKVSCGSQSRFLPLGRPQHLTPLVLDLDRGTGRITLPLEGGPDPESLRLQITGIEGRLPKHQMRPSDTVTTRDRTDPTRGTMSIILTPENAPQIEVRITFDVRARPARIDWAAYYQLPGQQAVQPLRGREVAGMMAVAVAAQQRFENAAKNLRDQAKQAAEDQAKAAKTAQEQLTALGKLYESLNRETKVQYRVYAAVDNEHQVELFTSKPADEQAAGDGPEADANNGDPDGPKRPPRGKNPR